MEWSVGNRHHLEARLSQLARLVPTLQLVQADARQLENTISFTHQLANNVSAKVRQLDLAKVCFFYFILMFIHDLWDHKDLQNSQRL